jgi:hypothetical protein
METTKLTEYSINLETTYYFDTFCMCEYSTRKNYLSFGNSLNILMFNDQQNIFFEKLNNQSEQKKFQIATNSPTGRPKMLVIII